MPDSLLIDVEDKAVLEALNHVPTEMEKRVRAAVLTTAGRVVAGAEQRARVRFGFLRDAIDYVIGKDGAAYVGINRKAKFRLPKGARGSTKSGYAWPSKYSHLIERGTSHSPAFPFLWPAANAEIVPNEARIREALNESIDAVGLGD